MSRYIKFIPSNTNRNNTGNVCAMVYICISLSLLPPVINKVNLDDSNMEKKPKARNNKTREIFPLRGSLNGLNDSMRSHVNEKSQTDLEGEVKTIWQISILLALTSLVPCLDQSGYRGGKRHGSNIKGRHSSIKWTGFCFCFVGVPMIAHNLRQLTSNRCNDL